MTPDKTKMLGPILPALFLLSAMLGSTLVLGQGGTGRVNTNTAKPASKKTSTPRKPTKTTGSTNNNSPADDSAANERTYWESIRLSTDAQDFKAYLQKYPKGQYVDLARNSLGRLEAAKSNSNTSPANTPAGGISLGTIPSYNDSSDGLLLDGVRDNSPAAKAGLKAGDKIVRMAGQEVKNVGDYSSILGKLKAGQEYEVEVLRAGQRLALNITPVARESLAAPSTMPRPCTPSPSGLVSWYSAESTANDALGANNGALINGASFAPGKIGQAFSFNGVNQYVKIPDGANMQPGALTISVWVNFSSPTNSGVVVSKYDGNWHGWLLQAFEGGNFMFQIERTTNVQKAASGSLGPIAPHTWVHVAGTYDGTNVRLYVNGSVVGAVTFEGGYTPTTTPMTIGKASWFDRDFLLGKIDEVELFSRALTAAEIAALAGIGAQGQCQAPANSEPLSGDPVLFPSDNRSLQSGDPKATPSTDPAEERVYSGKEVDQRAQILSKPAPMYTEEARKNVVSGTVVLKAVLRSSGQITHIRVIKGLPNGLTEQAIAAARRVKFTPAIKAGLAVSQEIQFEYNFSPY